MNVCDGGRILSAKGGGEPALGRGGGDGLHAVLSNGVDARVPHFRGPELGSGAADDEFIRRWVELTASHMPVMPPIESPQK